MMDATYKALIEGLLSALAEDDLDVSGIAGIDELRHELKKQGAQLGISETLENARGLKQRNQRRPIRPHHRVRHFNLSPEQLN